MANRLERIVRAGELAFVSNPADGSSDQPYPPYPPYRPYLKTCPNFSVGTPALVEVAVDEPLMVLEADVIGQCNIIYAKVLSRHGVLFAYQDWLRHEV